MANKPTYKELEQRVKELEKESVNSKRAEEALRESKEFVENLIASMQDGFSVLDSHGVQIDVNPAFCQMTGFSREELMGEGLPHLYWPPEEYEEIEKGFQKTLRGEFGDVELTFMRKNGERFPVIISPSWVKDKQGNVTSYFATVKDVTDRKRVEEDIKSSEVRFRELFNNMSSGVVVYEVRDDGNDFIIKDYNRTAEMITKVNRENIVGRSVLEVFPGIKEFGLFEVFQRAWKTGEPGYHPVSLYEDDYLSHWAENYVYKLPSGEIVAVFDDVTERKRTETALQESESRYRAFFEKGPDGVVILDPETIRPIEFNDQACRQLGYSREEFALLRISDIGVNETAEEAKEHIRKLMDKGYEDFDTLQRTKQGEIRHVHVTAQVIEAAGSPVYHCIWRDITERKRAEESLKLFRALIERSNDAIEVVDPKTGHFLDVNEKGCADLGYSRKEFLSLTVFDIDPKIDPSLYTEVLMKELRKTGSLSNESLHLRKDGSTFPVEINLSYVQLDRDYLVTVARDITERKQAEEALRRSQKMLARTESITHIGSWEWEIATDTVTWSEELFRIFQLDSDDRAPSWAEHPKLYHPEDFETLRQAVKDAVTNGTPYEMELRAFRKDGETRVCQARGFAEFGENGKPVHLFGSLHDITERKRMEEDLLKAQKLESVGVFAGGIAHDFNNILTTILGNVSLAKMRVRPEDKIFDLLSEAEQASIRAATLTKQLLTFAKGGAPVKEIASIKDILKESSLFVLRGSKSKCEFSIAEDLWSAEVDIGQISQVINNIVINANQAMPEGGIIQVAAENLIIDIGHGLPLKPGRYIRISITDQGVGIAEKHFLKVFDPYFTTKQKGSGLGLATTYSIIKNHDGHITVESTLGEGTTFHIYLYASEKAVPEKEGVRLITGHGKILVMDDEAPLRKIVERMLKNLGYESEFAEDGAEAIEMYKTARKSGKPYDAVILDLTVPGGMGGKEAIKKLLEIDPEVKAIVSSGYSDDPVLSNFQEYGFKGMMPKPFESRSLGKVLHEVLRGEKLNIED
jgi:PAS domain S-box-containing protein